MAIEKREDQVSTGYLKSVLIVEEESLITGRPHHFMNHLQMKVL